MPVTVTSLVASWELTAVPVSHALVSPKVGPQPVITYYNRCISVSQKCLALELRSLTTPDSRFYGLPRLTLRGTVFDMALVTCLVPLCPRNVGRARQRNIIVLPACLSLVSRSLFCLFFARSITQNTVAQSSSAQLIPSPPCAR